MMFYYPQEETKIQRIYERGKWILGKQLDGSVELDFDRVLYLGLLILGIAAIGYGIDKNATNDLSLVVTPTLPSSITPVPTFTPSPTASPEPTESELSKWDEIRIRFWEAVVEFAESRAGDLDPENNIEP